MRLFVAVDVLEGVRERIERDVVGGLRDALGAAKWTRPEGRHLTLKFLGNVEDERVDEIADALRSAVAGTAAFRAAFDAVGAFPSLRRPRVLWLGIGKGKDRLIDLAATVEDALAPLGFAREDRPFHPHLTLARFRPARVIEAVPDVDVPSRSFAVEEVVLFRSVLHHKGARYTPLQRFELRR